MGGTVRNPKILTIDFIHILRSMQPGDAPNESESAVYCLILESFFVLRGGWISNLEAK